MSKVLCHYKDFTTTSGRWRDGASERLDRRGRRQLWLNTLLAQSLDQTTTYAEGRAVVCSCAADSSAGGLVEDVRAELVDPQYLTWRPFEGIVAAVEDPSIGDWVSAFRARYLDFAPVAHLLQDGDPRLPQG